VVTAAALAANGAGGDGPSLAQIRAATAKFHDVDEALAAGYVQASPCVEAPGLGGMGFHYVNPRLASDPAIDPLQPELLLYAPGNDGGLKLVGVEYWTIALARTDAGPSPWFGAAAPPNGFVTSTPSLLGRPFDGPMAGHEPSMPWHFDRHVWIWLDNSSGMFAQFNPKVGC
jgi:hypothetical protein